MTAAATLAGLLKTANGMPWRTKPGDRHIIEPAIAECFGYACAEDYAELIVAAVNTCPELLAHIAALESALEPFADVGRYLASETIGYADDDRLMLTTKDQCGKSHGLIELKFGDLARAALTLKENEDVA